MHYSPQTQSTGSDKHHHPLLRGMKELIALQTGKGYGFKAKLLDDSGVLTVLCLKHLNTMGLYLPFTKCSCIFLFLLFFSLNMNDRQLEMLWGGQYFLTRMTVEAQFNQQNAMPRTHSHFLVIENKRNKFKRPVSSQKMLPRPGSHL